MIRDLRRLVGILVVMLATIGCDQAAKSWATRTLRGAPPRSLLADTVRLEYVENDGAFLGWGHAWSPRTRFWLLTVASSGALLLVLGALLRSGDAGFLSRAALALLAAGGGANVLDRALRAGRVIDFLNVGVGPVRTGIFNVADMAITCGVLCLFASAMRPRRPSEPPAVPPAAPIG